MTETPRLAEVRSEALRLFAQHGLTDWTFGFDSATVRMGVCRPMRKSITLSRIHAEHSQPADVTNTLLHEIAHALVEKPGQQSYGHGMVWKMKAISLGCDPTATSANPIPAEHFIKKGKKKRIFIPTEPGRKRLCKAQIGSHIAIPGHGPGIIVSAGSKNFTAMLDSGIRYIFPFIYGETYLVNSPVQNGKREEVAA